MAHIYWIKLEDHKDMTEEGYIGVSANIDRRFKDHLREMKNGGHTNPILNNVFEKYGEDKIKMQLVLEGEEDYCYLMEQKLRPEKDIGWNIAIGGSKPPVSESRGPDYVSPLKGRKLPPFTAEHANLSKALKGKNNPRAKKIEVDGVIYESITAYADAFKIKHVTAYGRARYYPENWGIKFL